ncbi:hypothetical protein NMD21_04380 [Citrobacter portucalensis]
MSVAPPTSLITPLPHGVKPVPGKPAQNLEKLRGVWLMTVSRFDWL